MLKKQNVHLMLHLVECMEQFGPTSSFCNRERYDDHNNSLEIKNVCKNFTKNCRCESFNSFISGPLCSYDSCDTFVMEDT